MSWLSNITPPGIKNMFRREDDGADSLWVKCAGCGDMIFTRDLEAAQHVCASCGFHMRMPIEDRLAAIFDDAVYETIAIPEPAIDPLKFRDEKKYTDRLKDARRKTGRPDAMTVARGRVDKHEAVVAVQNFDFMGGSMGMALGEALIVAAETAVHASSPLIVFTASGGARMQEGILSLMQMPRSTIAVQMMRDAGLPYVVVLTHPTTGGVTASYAMLGDIHIAEPGALIGFAGPRVIEQTIREKLPQEFQRSEFLLEKGMVDIVVHRHELKPTLAKIFRVLTNRKVRAENTDRPKQQMQTTAYILDKAAE
ncbi:MAG: acetyl-CoA carboxylase carboxyltransferase subunit beta [Parvularculaceae bacterium]|nr:acetyl-CoA carboxylase carboxyltransferase subunit beta [Parvularculaceae bacterium]